METKTEYKIPEPPADIFLYRNEAVFDIMNEGAITYMLTRIEYNDGVRVYIDGAKYPKKGFTTPEAIWSCNIIKRLILFIIRFPVLFIFVNKQNTLDRFNELGYKVMKHHIMKLNYMTPVAKELHIMIKTFLTNYGIKKQTAYETAVLVSHLFEYDDAYRWRIQDLMSEITKNELLECPRTTLDKMALLIYQRDNLGMVNKVNKIRNMLCVMLCLPKFRHAWNKMIEIMQIENLQYDDGDRYWVSNRDDYKFMGKTFEERYATMDPKPQGYRMKYE